MKRPTQVDVAKLAGVSRATVSLVVNGLADGKVSISEETRLRVLKAVEELGYEPDVRAQTLRSGDTRTIGMIAIDMYNPHHWEFAEGVEQEARENGYNILLFTRSLDRPYIQRMMKDLMGRRIEGLILSGRLIESSEDVRTILPCIQRHRLPVVEVNEYRPEYDLDCLLQLKYPPGWTKSHPMVLERMANPEKLYQQIYIPDYSGFYRSSTIVTCLF